jgi:hypothetical protein
MTASMARADSSWARCFSSFDQVGIDRRDDWRAEAETPQSSFKAGEGHCDYLVADLLTLDADPVGSALARAQTPTFALMRSFSVSSCALCFNHALRLRRDLLATRQRLSRRRTPPACSHLGSRLARTPITRGYRS